MKKLTYAILPTANAIEALAISKLSNSLDISGFFERAVSSKPDFAIMSLHAKVSKDPLPELPAELAGVTRVLLHNDTAGGFTHAGYEPDIIITCIKDPAWHKRLARMHNVPVCVFPDIIGMVDMVKNATKSNIEPKYGATYVGWSKQARVKQLNKAFDYISEKTGLPCAAYGGIRVKQPYFHRETLTFNQIQQLYSESKMVVTSPSKYQEQMLPIRAFEAAAAGVVCYTTCEYSRVLPHYTAEVPFEFYRDMLMQHIALEQYYLPHYAEVLMSYVKK
jgi:hypothetical protein